MFLSFVTILHRTGSATVITVLAFLCLNLHVVESTRNTEFKHKSLQVVFFHLLEQRHQREILPN